MFEQYNDSAPAAPDDSELRRRLASGAHWFYLIGGLSLINSVISLFDGNWNFAIGLGITQIFDGVGKIGVQEGFGNWIKYVFFAVDFLVAGVFALFGVFAGRGSIQAFVVGTILFALDAVILIFVSDILGIIIHALALYFLFRGLTAARRLSQIAKI